MENVTDALYIAFAVLIFVLALSISIYAFNQATIASQFILSTKDRQTEYTYVKYQDQSGNLQTDRIVSNETIVPVLYRAYEENYIVRFYNNDGTKMDILKIIKNGEWVATNEINLRNMSFGTQQEANQFVNDLLQGNITEENTKFNNRFKAIANRKVL